MTSENLNIVLTNSLCCISAQAAKTSKLLSIGSKCAEAEIQKLKLMNDWFKALQCYNIDGFINSKFILKTTYSTYDTLLNTISDSNKLYIFTINNIEYSIQGDNTTTVISLLENLSATITEIISFFYIKNKTKEPEFMFFYIDAKCNIETVNFKIRQIDNNSTIVNIDFTLYQTGYCTVPNCLTEKQFNIIVANLMAACDICECQLTQ